MNEKIALSLCAMRKNLSTYLLSCSNYLNFLKFPYSVCLFPLFNFNFGLSFLGREKNGGAYFVFFALLLRFDEAGLSISTYPSIRFVFIFHFIIYYQRMSVLRNKSLWKINNKKSDRNSSDSKFSKSTKNGGKLLWNSSASRAQVHQPWNSIKYCIQCLGSSV